MNNNQYYQRLTKGAIGHMLNGTRIDEPVLQMLAYKDTSNEGARRYRLVMSDGAYTYQLCIMMGDLCNRIEQEFDRYCLLKLSRYMLNEIQNRQVIVLAEPVLLVRGSEVGERLGEAVPYGSENAPPLSSFRPNYHLQNNEMAMEIENDPLDDMDNLPVGGMQANVSRNAGARNAAGQANNRSNQSRRPPGTLNPQQVIPISGVNPYNNKWTIKGRCMAKTNIRKWSNAKGEGSLFSFDLKDQSGDIRITAFKEQCTQYFDIVKVGDVYLLSGGRVKDANKQYTKTTSPYEVTLGQESVLEPCDDNDSSCPEITYDFKKISEVGDQLGSFCDVVAIIKSTGSVDTVTKKGTNKELFKRDLIIVDDSKMEIALTVWGDTATNLTAEVGSVVVGRALHVSDFNGLSLSASVNSHIEFDPDMDEAHELKGWYMRVKDGLTTKNLTEKRTGSFQAEWKNLFEVSAENVRDSVLTLQTKAVISQMGKTSFYKGCKTCNKKMMDMNNGFFRCDKCNSDTTEFNYRLILSFAIADHTRQVWVQAFHDECLKILGPDTNLEELYSLFENNSNEFEDRIKAATFSSYIFKLRSKMEHYNDEGRVRSTVSGLHPVNYVEYANELLKKIRD